MSDLKSTIAEFSDDFLLEQFVERKDDYTSEAIELMKKEIDSRGITQEKIQDFITERKKQIPLSMDINDFVSLKHNFSNTDILFAHTILQDSKIPFFVNKPEPESALPIESEASRVFTINVHKDFQDKAKDLLEEHFEPEEGVYRLKVSGVRDRLKLFSFQDAALSEKEAAEKVDVSFTYEERQELIRLGKKILKDVEEIEKRLERYVFYFDSIEDVNRHLEKENQGTYTKTELLAILEIMQIFVDELPASMDETISALLDFFVGN